MIPLVEPTSSLNGVAKQLDHSSAVLCSLIQSLWQPLSCAAQTGVDVRFDDVALCLIEDGHAIIRGLDKRLLVLESGDLFVPSDFTQPNADLQMMWESPLRVRVISRKDLQVFLADDRSSSAFNDWQQRQRIFMWCLLAQHVAPAPSPHTGFRRYQPGEVIISEGDAAEFVYTLLDGKAEVFAGDIKVGEVGSDEIFGAMAALAGTPRSATVKAATECQVMMVARDEFYLLVNSHPQLFINLLRDMARVIVSLNEKVVSLKGR